MKPSSSSPPRRKLTPKQRVLKKYPNARLWSDIDGHCHIRLGYQAFYFAIGETASAAWADAARRL